VSALVATAAALPAAVSAGIAWVTVRGRRRQAARLRRRLFEGLDLDAERDAAIDILGRAVGAATLQPIHVANGFEAQKRGMPDAYRDTVLLWEIGMRAFQELDAPEQTGGAR
jgi:hypothetical protein